MGKLIKNHLARLIIMTAAMYHIAASLHGFFWPKFFFDFLTKNFDPAVKPVPILQTINLIFAFINLAWEWPLEFLAGTAIHRSLELRILLLPLLRSLLLGVYRWRGDLREALDVAAKTKPSEAIRTDMT
ncbi:hypothetical protein KCV07_g7206, partial [Aureobasidium melanogenum]